MSGRGAPTSKGVIRRDLVREIAEGREGGKEGRVELSALSDWARGESQADFRVRGSRRVSGVTWWLAREALHVNYF